MVEVSNKLLEQVLRKTSPDPNWDTRLPQAARSVNSRIIPYLGLSPTAIMLGPAQETSPTSATLRALPGRNIQTWHDELLDPTHHNNAVHTYLRHIAEVHDVVTETTMRKQEMEAYRYNKGITETVHHIGDLVMLYQKDAGKLQPRWRGLFRINGYGGSHGVSFTLQQLNGRGIKGAFHGDHLKRFRPRTGYLIDSTPHHPLTAAAAYQGSSTSYYSSMRFSYYSMGYSYGSSGLGLGTLRKVASVATEL